MTIKILHIIGNLDIGGAQASLYHLWPALNKSEKFSSDFCVSHYVGHYGRLLTDEKAQIFDLNVKGKYSKELTKKINSLVVENNYKIIHVHLFPEFYIVPFALRAEKHISLVYTEHNTNNHRRKHPMPFRFLDRCAYSRYKRIITVGKSADKNLRLWQPWFSEKINMIPNCVRAFNIEGKNNETRELLLSEIGISSSNDVPLLLFAGRLAHAKGCDLLINALSTLETKDYICIIAGDGPERERLQSLVQAMGLQNKIFFLGFRHDIPDLLSCVDFIIVPSRWEGLPIIVLEAMKAGCPIVATAVEGIIDLVTHEESALLVPSEQPKLLSDAIHRMIINRDLRRKLTLRAMLDVNTYTNENVANKLYDLYENII